MYFFPYSFRNIDSFISFISFNLHFFQYSILLFNFVMFLVCFRGLSGISCETEFQKAYPEYKPSNSSVKKAKVGKKQESSLAFAANDHEKMKKCCSYDCLHNILTYDDILLSRKEFYNMEPSNRWKFIGFNIEYQTKESSKVKVCVF